jgi:hypothetical protein
MIAIFIFYIHIVGAVYAFAQGYVAHKRVDGFLAVAFFGIIFSVGWTIAGFIVRFFLPKNGFGILLDRDTISLIIVTLLEVIMYSTYFLRRKNSGDQDAMTAG